MPEVTPVSVESSIRSCAERIANGVIVCDERYRAYLDVDHAFDLAEAHAYLEHDGPAHEKKFAAVIATKEERKKRDVADAAYRYADRQARALTEELRSWQSVGASLRQQYGVAGRGEGA